MRLLVVGRDKVVLIGRDDDTLQADVIRYLSDGPAPRSKIIEHFTRLGYSPDSVANTLQRLKSARILVSRRIGRRAVYTLAAPVYEWRT